ncbi:hypothetical protein [Dehalobacter sp. TeCB1]|uniref:hypothetical protein n=1 Tax=Dehalobacter sp. TeCB1 TaxID=1843715 RepID=UPI00083AF224|nr:hypothetical protein [Dehalobacter sp. TeCB1]OCZ51374.1 hypothetical protein A7D23_13210 [Dehalobacter sp. TeCB1]
MYVYIKSEPNLWTVGFYDPKGKWQPESDHGSPEFASRRVRYLNGGNIDDQQTVESPLHQAIIDEIEYMIEGRIFFDYFDKEKSEKIEAIFNEHKAEIIEKNH